MKDIVIIVTGGLFADSVRIAGLSPSNGNFMATQNTAAHPRFRLGSNVYVRDGLKIITPRTPR